VSGVETRQALVFQKAFSFHACGELHRCEGRMVETGTRFADAIATLGARRVFWQVHRVNTGPELMGPVGFEPTTKGL